MMTGNLFVTCALMLEKNHCDAIVRAEVQMPDLSTSHALLNMQQPKIRDGMVMI
jgi:hypothetical protein